MIAAASSAMSWSLVIALSAGALAFKIAGLVVVGTRKLPVVLERCLVLIPAALLAALVAKDTFSRAHQLGFDERLAGLVVAVIAVWRRAPLIVVVILAAATTALLRAAG